jgi:hypothetical protein
VLERFLRADPAVEALLLFEDTDIERRRAVVDARVSLISTGDFLRELEMAGLIQSTDYILDLATAQGRNVERQRQASDDSVTRASLAPPSVPPYKPPLSARRACRACPAATARILRGHSNHRRAKCPS